MGDYAKQADEAHARKVARARDMLEQWMAASGELLATIEREGAGRKVA